jgi:hypothetical protein
VHPYSFRIETTGDGYKKLALQINKVGELKMAGLNAIYLNMILNLQNLVQLMVRFY